MSLYSHKLTPQAAELIRSKLDQNIPMAQIAKEFNVSITAIFKIKHNITYKRELVISVEKLNQLTKTLKTISPKLNNQENQKINNFLEYLKEIKTE